MSTTANVVVTQSGTGFLVDVTACNLDPSSQVKDFVALTGNPATVANQANWTKISQTSVQYTGAALPANTRVEIRRRTQYDPYALAAYQTFINFNDYNRELTRATRIFYEQALNGIGSTGNLANSVLDGVYNTDWATDTLNTASRRRLYDQFELKFDKSGGNINGTVTITGTNGLNMTGGSAAIGGSLLVGQNISTVAGGLTIAGATALGSTATVGNNPAVSDLSQNIASTAWIRNGLANGNWNISCATPGASSDNFDSANTSWVRAHLAGTPALGAATVTTPALSDGSTRAASTAWVRSWIASGVGHGAGTATTPAITDNSTRIATTAFVNSLMQSWVVGVATCSASSVLAANDWRAMQGTWAASWGTLQNANLAVFTIPSNGIYRLSVDSGFTEVNAGTLAWVALGFNVGGTLHVETRPAGIPLRFQWSCVRVIGAGSLVYPLVFPGGRDLGSYAGAVFTVERLA